jgi:cold-inducible RNA-binding protein
MSKRLFVGNLSFETSEADLNAAFSQWGGSNAAIPTNESGRPKGFGFIEVGDDQADAAINAMNGKDLHGRTLTVNEARPREDRGGGGGYGRGGGGGGYGGGGGGRDRGGYGGGGGGGRRW